MRLSSFYLPGLCSAVLALASVGPLHASISVLLSGPAVAFQSETPPGSSVTLRLNIASGTDAPPGSYQWLFNDVPLAAARSPTLRLDQLTAAQTGNYRLRYTSPEARIELSNTLTLNVVPPRPDPLDSNFHAELPANVSSFEFIASTSDGHLLLKTYELVGTVGLYRVVTLRSDGSFESSFELPADAEIAGALPDRRILLRGAPYRLSVDGRPDPIPATPGFDLTQKLNTVLPLRDGRLLLAQLNQLYCLQPDDTPDPAFTYASQPGHPVTSLAEDPAGRILVNSSIRLSRSGAVDPAFHPFVSGISAESLEIFPLPTGYLVYRNYRGGEAVRYSLLADDGTVVFTQTGAGGMDDSRMAPPVVDSAGRIYIVTLQPQPPISRYLITTTGFARDPTFFPGASTNSIAQFNGLLLRPDGQLLVKGSARSENAPYGSTGTLVRLRTDLPPVGMVPLVFASAPVFTGNMRGGDPLTLTSEMVSAEPASYQWLALDGQPLPADHTSATLVIPSAYAGQLGRYQLRVTNTAGSILSEVLDFSLPTLPVLANLSGRAMTGTGEDTVIAGFSATPAWDPLIPAALLRGAGPSLQRLGVTHFLPDPAIELYNGSGQLLATNDQWSDHPEVARVATVVGAFAFTLGSNDAALLRGASGGSATVMLKSRGTSAAGVGLLEVYRTSVFPYNPYNELVNLSFRARTAAGDATAIAGFVIVDPQDFGRPARVLLRAVGPTLATQGIVHPLENPVLSVYDSAGQLVAQNDDWSLASAANPSAPADLTAAMKQVGAFELPANSHDAALLLDLPAGAYSMHATGGSGVVLLEIYLVR